MSQPWSVVEASPQYQALAPDAQSTAKQQYFSQVVSQNPDYQKLAPADQQAAQAQFMGSSPVANTAQTDPNATPSVASEGFNFFKDHPFKAMFQGIGQTMTGQTYANKMQDAVQQDIPQATQKPFDSNIAPAQANEGNVIAAKTAAGTYGGVVDAATAPVNAVMPDVGALAGKIPVGATNIGRVASNIAVGKEFPQGVADMQALDSKLGNLDTSASGKAVDTSSRGITNPTVNPAANQAILNAYNAIVQPTQGKFTSPAKLNSYNTQAVSAMKTINDWSDITGVNLTNKSMGMVPTSNRSDLLDAVQKTKQAIWDNVDSTAKNASMAGATVDMGKVAGDIIAPLLQNPSILRQRPDLIPFLNSTLKTYSDSGNISIDEAQSDLKILNDDIGKYMRSSNPNDASVGAVKLAISQNMRGQMDIAIEDHLGQTGYQQLRNQYGALSSVESDITKAAARQAKGPTGLAHPMLDVMSGVDVGKALINAVSGNPVGAAKEAGLAGIYQAVKGGIDYMRSPDVKIAGMFNNINRNIGRTAPNISSSQYYNPAIKTLGKFADSNNPQFTPTPKSRPEAAIDNTNPNVNSTPPKEINPSPSAITNQTNPNVGPYQGVSPNSMDALIKAHREVDMGNLQQQDVQNALDMANNFKQNNVSQSGMNVKKFSNLDSLNSFVGNNEDKIELISTDSKGNFYAHLKGK